MTDWDGKGTSKGVGSNVETTGFAKKRGRATRGTGPLGLCRRAAQPQDTADERVSRTWWNDWQDQDLLGHQSLGISKDRGLR
jgi:hypothetical protein